VFRQEAPDGIDVNATRIIVELVGHHGTVTPAGCG